MRRIVRRQYSAACLAKGDDFYWPGYSGAVTKLCHSCEECQKAARRRRRYAPLQVMPIIKVPFTRIAMDMVGQWDKALPYILGEYRTMPNETTGFTPSELYFGRQIRTPLKALKERWTADKPSTENVASYFKNLTDRFE